MLWARQKGVHSFNIDNVLKCLLAISGKVWLTHIWSACIFCTMSSSYSVCSMQYNGIHAVPSIDNTNNNKFI